MRLEECLVLRQEVPALAGLGVHEIQKRVVELTLDLMRARDPRRHLDEMDRVTVCDRPDHGEEQQDRAEPGGELSCDGHGISISLSARSSPMPTNSLGSARSASPSRTIRASSGTPRREVVPLPA